MTTPRFRRLLVLLCLPGCHVWAPVQLTPARDFGRNAQVRVARMDSSTVVFYGPRVVGDSVVGIWAGSSARTAVALADVRGAKEYQLSRTRTALAALGVATGVVVVAGVLLLGVAVGLNGVLSSAP